MKLLKVLVMIPLTAVMPFALILLFFGFAALVVKVVEIWLGAEPFFQVLGVLFLAASTGMSPSMLRRVRGDR